MDDYMADLQIEYDKAVYYYGIQSEEAQKALIEAKNYLREQLCKK